MGLVSLPIGASNSGTNDWSDVNGEDQAIVDVVNGNIENVNIKASAGIEDSKLASPNNSVYKTIIQTNGILMNDAAAGTYFLGSWQVSDSGAQNGMLESGTATHSMNSASRLISGPDLIYFDNDDFTVGSKTQKLRLRAQVAANATAPAINFTFGLYPITVAGAADILTLTAGTVIASSTVALNTPSASTITAGVNSDFTIPSDGAHAICVVTSGSLAASSLVAVHAQLQTRNT